ncbi:Protein SMG9 [Amphibalanus amphitrite]|uniref:Protein SMG9 n=1 Tax=Amphibalanus amphitrite TaxID=1232801 RepID=A0A6A4VPD4_AMPAM|nr:Protein SMG9 [Amphibalanus amphitrite]
MDSPRPVLLTKASEAAAELGRPSSTERAVTVMRKDDTVLLPSVEGGASDTGGRRPAASLSVPPPPPQPMSRPCPLLSESLQVSDTGVAWLGEGTEFLVVGAVGRQGVGKSTVMSMLAGQAPFCPIKKYMFPPETVQQVLSSEHRTNGIEMMVTGQRAVLLDTQPLLSPSIVDLLAQGDRKLPGDGGSLETQMELLALQQLAFLYSICHVVLVVQDWCVDSDLVSAHLIPVKFMLAVLQLLVGYRTISGELLAAVEGRRTINVATLRSLRSLHDQLSATFESLIAAMSMELVIITVYGIFLYD